MNVDGKTLTDIYISDINNNGSFTVPNGIVEIEEYTFVCLDELKEVIFPDSLEIIGDNAFSDCCNLRKIVIPYSVISIGENVFEYCNSLEFIDLNNYKILNKDIFGEECNPKCKVKFKDKIYTVEDIVDYDIKFDLR